MGALATLFQILLLLFTGLAFAATAIWTSLKYMGGEDIETPVRIVVGGLLIAALQFSSMSTIAMLWSGKRDAQLAEQAMSEKVLETEQDMQSMRQICIEKFK